MKFELGHVVQVVNVDHYHYGESGKVIRRFPPTYCAFCSYEVQGNGFVTICKESDLIDVDWRSL